MKEGAEGEDHRVRLLITALNREEINAESDRVKEGPQNILH